MWLLTNCNLKFDIVTPIPFVLMFWPRSSELECRNFSYLGIALCQRLTIHACMVGISSSFRTYGYTRLVLGLYGR